MLSVLIFDRARHKGPKEQPGRQKVNFRKADPSVQKR